MEGEPDFGLLLEELARQGARFALYGRSGYVSPRGQGVQAAERFLDNRAIGPQFLKFTPPRSRESIEVKDPERFKLWLQHQDDPHYVDLLESYDARVRRYDLKPEQARRYFHRLSTLLEKRGEGSRVKEFDRNLSHRFWSRGLHFEAKLEAITALLLGRELDLRQATRMLDRAVEAKVSLQPFSWLEPDELVELGRVCQQDEPLFAVAVEKADGQPELAEMLHQGRRALLAPDGQAGLLHYTQEPELGERIYELKTVDPDLFEGLVDWLDRNFPTDLDFDQVWEKVLEESLYGSLGPQDIHLHQEEDFLIIGDTVVDRS